MKIMKFITILLTVFVLESCGNTKAATNLQNNKEAKQTEMLSGKYMISSFIDNTELPENIHLNFDATCRLQQLFYIIFYGRKHYKIRCFYVHKNDVQTFYGCRTKPTKNT